MSDTERTAMLSDDEAQRLANDRRLRDYPLVELFDDDRELGRIRLLRWLRERGAFAPCL